MRAPKRFLFLAPVWLALACAPTLAQVELHSSAFGGGAAATDGRALVVGTIGQALTGAVSDGIIVVGQGFWYTMPELDPSGVSFGAATTAAGVRLHQNVPNPFSSTTTMAFDLPSRSHVSLKLFDVAGNEVRILVDETRESGRTTITLSADRLESGYYSARLIADGVARTIMLVVVR